MGTEASFAAAAAFELEEWVTGNVEILAGGCFSHEDRETDWTWMRLQWVRHNTN
jgi:hypothetical protein